MSLDVALQSVAFYVLSCSTCAKINHRRKAKAEAKRERVEKHALEVKQPGLYRHPSPFSTNPYWNEEIMMGPGPLKKNERCGSKTASRRGLITAGSETPSSPTTVTESSGISGEGWNRKRYQREDEALWGHEYPGPGQRLIDAVAKAGTAAGRLLEGGLSIISPAKEDEIEESTPNYYTPRNPPVNDLHPPVVSTAPSSKAETRWMLQPPPRAKIMEGKEKVNISRTSSNTSSRKDGVDVPLGRQVTERLVDAKVQRGETPTQPEVQTILSRAGSRSKLHKAALTHVLRRERSSSLSDLSDSSRNSVRKRTFPTETMSIQRNSRDAAVHVPISSTSLTSEVTTSITDSKGGPTISSSSTILNLSKTRQQVNLSLALCELSASSANNSRATSPSRKQPVMIETTSLAFTETKVPKISTYTVSASISEENYLRS